MLYELISITVVPYIAFILTVAFLASIGKDVGVRILWVHMLVKVFEWGKQKIEKHDRTHSTASTSTESEHVIEREIMLDTDGIHLQSPEQVSITFQLSDVTYFAKNGMEAIIEDQVTQRFDAEEITSWNLLTRTNTHPQFISWRLSLMWAIGGILRYIVLFPFRFGLAVTAISNMAVWCSVIGMLPRGRFQRWANRFVNQTCLRIMARAFSAVVNFHNSENRAKNGICVANHTSPLDIIILGTDTTYAMVGQKQGGFMGFIQRSFSKAENHVWFQRGEAKDRQAVARRLKEHIENPDNLPILIFPEGTCINNTSIMMFKKGSFEVGGTIYPAAIKYDPRFSDAFWNSSKYSLLQHFFMVMTSWALVVDVWYLPPVTQQPNETAVHFANRVKADIAQQGGLVDLTWDGGLKRAQPKEAYKALAQEQYSIWKVKGE